MQTGECSNCEFTISFFDPWVFKVIEPEDFLTKEGCNLRTKTKSIFHQMYVHDCEFSPLISILIRVFITLINVLTIFLNICIFAEYFHVHYVTRIYRNSHKLITGNNLNIQNLQCTDLRFFFGVGFQTFDRKIKFC